MQFGRVFAELGNIDRGGGLGWGDVCSGSGLFGNRNKDVILISRELSFLGCNYLVRSTTTRSRCLFVADICATLVCRYT